MARDREARAELVRSIVFRLERGDSRGDILKSLTSRGLTREEAKAVLREASPPRRWAVKAAAVLLLSLVIWGVVSWRMELLPDIVRAVRPAPTATPTPPPAPTATPVVVAQATATLAPVAAATQGGGGIVPIPAPLPLPISLLNFRVIDAEYSKTLDRIIMVSSGPNQLHVYDPVAQKDTVVDLPLLASAVSVSPEGRYAAVGHDAWISYIDLASASLVKMLPVSTDALDVVLGGNGYVYAFPRRDQWETIRSINIATGVETQSGAASIYAGTVAKLHPNGGAVYGVTNTLSPSDIARYSIEEGTADPLYDSPYHGDYPMCGDLWISEEGLRIFTQCGNVFRSSNVRNEDMLYSGSLREAGGFVRHLTHSDVIDKVILIPGSPYGGQVPDRQVQVYDYKFLTFEKALGLPEFVVGDRSYPGHGRFVFVSGDGSRIFVVLQADQSSGMLFDYGVVSLNTQEFVTVTVTVHPTPTPTPTWNPRVAVNFDGDVPGQPPMKGGTDKPTSLFTSPGTTIAVRSAANGIETQPVVLTSEELYVSVDTSFSPVDEGVVRVEATVAFDRLVDGYFLQTEVPVSFAVVTRLTMTSKGDIQASGVTVGSYDPNQPFRVRTDIDMSGKTWSVTVDNELNGFHDDLVFTDLQFDNPASVVPQVGEVGASLRLFSTSSLGPTSVAYDDIRVWVFE